MKYFGYSAGGRNSSQYQLARIFNAVLKMENLAKARYGGRFQDALDAALFHIIENYDSSMDDSDENLEHYTASIVNTIYRNNGRREVLSDTVLDIESNNQVIRDMELEDPFEGIGVNTQVEFEKDVAECIELLLPNFLKDYELFKNRRASDRKMSYRGVYNRFSDAVINESVKRMSKEYEGAKYLSELGKSCKLRTFAPDRYKASMDEAISFNGMINGIAVCTFTSSRVKRNVYMVHINDFIDEAINRFYTGEKAVGYRKICGHDIYCTLSGKEVDGEEKLRVAIENDIVGALLAKVVSLRVVDYKPGSYLLVSSSKPEEYGLVLHVFGSDVVLQMTRLTVRRVVLQEC